MIYVTDKGITTIDFTSNDIFDLIKSLDIGKAHGYDDISVRMIKICGKSICRPLELIFRDSVSLGTVPDIWKKSNVVPVHKKNEKIKLKTIDLFHYFLCAAKLWKDSYSTPYIIF